MCKASVTISIRIKIFFTSMVRSTKSNLLAILSSWIPLLVFYSTYFLWRCNGNYFHVKKMINRERWISPYSFAHAFFLINTCGIYVIAWTKREIWLERDGGNETISNTSIVYISVYIKNTENDERRMLLNVSSSFSNWHLDFDWFDFPSYHKFPGNFLEIPFDLQHNTRQQTSMCV